MLAGHATVLLFTLMGAGLALVLVRVLGPRLASPLPRLPADPLSTLPGEGGEPLVGDHRPPFPSAALALTLVCLVLVTGLLLLWPWAVVASTFLVPELQAAGRTGAFALVSALVCLTLLTVGMIHGWRHGGLSPHSPTEEVAGG